MKPFSGFPAERQILPSFSLPDENGRKVDLEQFRQRYNLVVLFLKNISLTTEPLLKELAGAADAIAAEEARVIAVIHGNREDAALLKSRSRLPFAVLWDASGSITGPLCAGEAAIYVTDKFREIFALRHGTELLSRDEILEWLAHINRQCPE